MARNKEAQQSSEAKGNNTSCCCFKVEPFQFRHQHLVENLGDKCQFANEYPKGRGLIEVGQHRFCRYHLPFNEKDFADITQSEVELSKAEKAKLKSEWTDNQRRAFNQAILNQMIPSALNNKIYCDLTGVVFPGDFKTADTHFPAISFAHARFPGGGVMFRGVQFSGGEAVFNNAQFSGGDAWFQGARFSGGDARFDDAQFSGGDAWFDGAQFSGGNARFDGAEFSGGRAWFAGAQFSGGYAWFRNAQFAGDASFAAPRHDARARQGQNPGDFDFSHVSFRSAQFEASVTFENRWFTRKTDFTDARFAKAPQFHGCDLHQDTVFPPMENFGGRDGEEAAPAYRTLKLAMGQHRATDEEAMFWALEQIATRATLEPLQHPRDIMPWVFSWLYEKASFYGLSVTRPLVLFLTSTFIAFPFYVYQPLHEFAVSGMASDGITLREIADAVSFSMRQVTRPFDIWSRYDLDALKLLYPAATEQTSYFWTKLIATGQSVVSLALVTLFLLALRRRFRMV